MVKLSPTLVLNKIRGTFNVVQSRLLALVTVVKLIEDIAVLTGVQLLLKILVWELKDTTIDALGQAARVTVDKDSTVIVEGSVVSEAVANRVNSH